MDLQSNGNLLSQMPTVENILDYIMELERNKRGATRMIMCPTSYTMLKEALGYTWEDTKEITRYHDLEISVTMEDDSFVLEVI